MDKNDRYDSLIQYYAGLNDLDWLLVKAQIRAESNFDPDAKSWCNALGLSQFMRATWEEWKDGKVGISEIVDTNYSRTNPEHSIRAMCAYISWIYKYMDKNIKPMFEDTIYKNIKNNLMFASYNWGVGSVRKEIKKISWFVVAKLPKETQDYIKRIDEYYQEYKNSFTK